MNSTKSSWNKIGLNLLQLSVIAMFTNSRAHVQQNAELLYTGWVWKSHLRQKMINKMASTFQVGRRLNCMNNCTTSPICDSYNYRPADKTCQLHTHQTQHTLDSCVHTDSGLVLLTRCASSTRTTLNTLYSCVHTGSGLVFLTRRASSTHSRVVCPHW